MLGQGKRPRPSPGGARGSRILIYGLAAVVVIILAYYILVPYLTPKPVVGPAVFLGPSTDISGATIILSGQSLKPNHNITAQFNGHSLNLSGTCLTDSKGSLGGCTFIVPNSQSGTYQVTANDGDVNHTLTANFTVPRFTPPESTLIVTLTSLGLGLVTQLVTRRVVDLKAERRMRAEVNSFNSEKRKLQVELQKLKGQDQNRQVLEQTRSAQAKLDKLKKRELQVRQDQAKLSTGRFKVTAITFVPLLAVYYLMSSFLGGFNVVVAFTPIQIPLLAGAAQGAGWSVSLFWWYFLSSFTFGALLGRLLHTTTT